MVAPWRFGERLKLTKGITRGRVNIPAAQVSRDRTIQEAERSINRALGLLSHPNPDMRAVAIGELRNGIISGKVSPTRVKYALHEINKRYESESHPDVRVEIVKLNGLLGNHNFLERVAKADKHPDVRAQAIIELGKSNHPDLSKILDEISIRENNERVLSAVKTAVKMHKASIHRIKEILAKSTGKSMSRVNVIVKPIISSKR